MAASEHDSVLRLLGGKVPSARLNVLCVGLALSTFFAPIFGGLLAPELVPPVALSTLVVGTLWAWVLRLPHTIGRTPVRWGWLVSIPLAALNGGLSMAIATAFFDRSGNTESLGRLVEAVLSGGFLGVTFGAIFWIPCLVLVLTLFGVPIAYAQKAAMRGLVGEELGERFVALACMVLSLVGITVTATLASMADTHGSKTWSFGQAGLLVALGGLATTLSLVSAGLAHARHRQRQRFVSDVRAGLVEGYRVAAHEDGEMLLHVRNQDAGYRVPEAHEPLALLDDANDIRPVGAQRRAPGQGP